MPALWDYLYLHTGDILRFGSKGARLGRKISKKRNGKPPFIHVDDDLPGERLEVGGSDRGYKDILTMPHGARAVPVVLPIQSDDLIEGGDRPAFQIDIKKKKQAGRPELESGTILVEDSIFVTLADLTSEAWKNFEEKARKTRSEMDAIERPNLGGSCPIQKANKLVHEIWVKVAVRGNTECYAEIEEVLYNLNQLGPRLFEYLEPSLLDTLETRLMFDTIKIWNDEFYNSGKADAHSLIKRFTHQFETIEKLSAGKWKSSFILPCSKSGMIDGVYQSEHIEMMLDRTGLGILMPFIEGLEAWSSGDATPDNWLELLRKLKSVFPTLNNLGWTEHMEGNDLMMDRQFHDNLLSAVLIDFIPYLLEGLEKAGRGVGELAADMGELGILLREGGIYHRGHRVVCDRIRHNTEKPVQAWLELYDNNGKLLDEQEIGNDAKLTHGQESLEYRGCGWMVIRIVPYHPPPINPRDFSALTYPGDPNLPREENLDRRPHPNPVEAFVTLPWFIRWDGKRKGVGVIDDDSKQLVHVHFIETVNSSQGYPVAIIPLIKGSQHQGFDVKKLAKKSVLDSYTTICFRTMFSNPPESSEYYSEDEVAPGTKWWVERPSRMKK